MAGTKYRNKSKRQIEAEWRKYYSCDNCKWGVPSANYCKSYGTTIDYIYACNSFEVKQDAKRDCTKCIHYNKRKNAVSKCKIGIYNCKGVVNE